LCHRHFYSHGSRRDFPRKDSRAIRYAKVTNTEKEYKKILTDAINNRRETIDMCEAAERAFKKEREEGIEEGMEKGMEKGEKKGEKKGIEKGIKITKMILSGKSDEEIMESMELTGEELEKLKKKLEED
jgi:flagellar biosynthesis/type III secretory pathway protein FliH